MSWLGAFAARVSDQRVRDMTTYAAHSGRHDCESENVPRPRMHAHLFARLAMVGGGEHKTADDGFTEFYPDAGSVEQAVLELFWEPVE